MRDETGAQRKVRGGGNGNLVRPSATFYRLILQKYINFLGSRAVWRGILQIYHWLCKWLE